MALRLIDIADGFSSSAVPSDLQIQASAFVNFSSASAFIANKGVPAAEGDIFFNTTSNQLEAFLGGAWVPFENELISSRLTLSNGDTLPINTSKNNQTIYVKGGATAVTLSTHPFGLVRPKNGTLITVVGLDDVKKVSIVFEDSDYGVYSNMPIRELMNGQLIVYKWADSQMRWLEAGGNF